MEYEEYKTIAIDSSTTSCGIAIFINGVLDRTFTEKFDGTYSLEKLQRIAVFFEDLFSEENPDFILIEEPAPVRNSKAITSLNQVAGCIVGIAYIYRKEVLFIHNRTIKKLSGYKTKEEGIKKAKRLYKVKDITEHESDALMMFHAYMEMINEKD